MSTEREGAALALGELLSAESDQSAIVTSSTIRPSWSTFIPVGPFCRVSFGAAVTDTASVFLLPLTVR